MMPAHYAANGGAFCVAVDPLSPLKCGLRLVNRYPRRSPSSLCSNRRINLYPVGIESRTKVPHASLRGHRAPRGMGPIYYAAYCSPALNRSHIHLGNGTFFLSSLRRFYLLLRTAPSGTTPVSR